MSAFKDYLREMKERETLRENELSSIILDILREGIDIDPKTKTVAFNPNHERGANTSIELNPTYNKVNGVDVISIFQRNKLINGDANPLIHALKGNNGWSIDDKSILDLFRNFIKISKKIKPSYDTVISVYSSSSLNNDFLYRLNKIIKCKNSINDLFHKIPASEIAWDGLLTGASEDEYLEIDKRLQKMISNGDYFTYKEIPTKLRKYIDRSSIIDANDILKYTDMINEKNVLILDDTISSGKTISDNVETLLNTFEPKSVTIVTLFGPLN